MTIVFIHGIPETWEIWTPLSNIIKKDSVSLKLPGFASPRPKEFTATKDAYAEWLANKLLSIEKPIDIVSHDIGALITMRVISAFDIPIRSWIADVAPIFHPTDEWPDRMKILQTPVEGEKLIKETREANIDDPKSTASRLHSVGVPIDLAKKVGKEHDEAMSQCILDFYRSAIPNVAKDWWKDIKEDIKSKGLILLLPDPPEEEKKSLEVARKLKAKTVRLDNLNHCWMAEAPNEVAPIFLKFWSNLNSK